MSTKEIKDQSTDLGGRLQQRLAQIITFPTFVKNAELTAQQGDPSLDTTHYADLRRRLFPTHTSAATWLSLGHFLQCQDQYPAKEARWVRDRLEERVRFHQITGAAYKLTEKYADFCALSEEDQLPDDAFAVVVSQPDGSKIRRFPLRNPGEIKQAAEYYVRWRDETPFPVRQLFAKSVLDKAQSYGMQLGAVEETLTKAAGRGACAARDAAALLVDRVLLTKKAAPGRLGPLQIELLKLAKLVAERPSQTRAPGALEKLATVLDQYDRAHGLHRHYGRGCPRPEDALFAVTKEAAAQLVRDNVETITGHLYRLQDLERLRVQDVRDCLGDDYAEALSLDGLRVDSEKAAAVIPTLPKPDAKLFDLLCQERGVVAWGQTKKAQTQQLGLEYLQRLRTQFQPAG